MSRAVRLAPDAARYPLLRDAESLAEAVVDTVREPLLILDADLCVRWANAAFYETFRVLPEETEGRLLHHLGSGQWDTPALRSLLGDILQHNTLFEDFELAYDFPAIGPKVMLLNARRLQSRAGSALLLLAVQDVTLQRHLHLLELRFTSDLQDSYQRLTELERLRDDLTRMIIHDLRTPLTSVITGMQTLDALGDLNPAQREMMEIAVTGGQTLLGMVNDLLDVEKLESGTMELDQARVGVAGLVSSAIAQVAALIESRQLQLHQITEPALPPLRCDEGKLRRTLVNLLGNAIKFTPCGGTITVAARRSPDGRFITLSVTDTGQGIPAEAFGRIFEKFGQVHSPGGVRAAGTGLGLPFCKLVVEAHGGDIGVESEPGLGSTFKFTVPCRQWRVRIKHTRSSAIGGRFPEQLGENPRMTRKQRTAAVFVRLPCSAMVS